MLHQLTVLVYISIKKLTVKFITLCNMTSDLEVKNDGFCELFQQNVKTISR